MIPPPSARFLPALAASHERQIRVTLNMWIDNQLAPMGPVLVADGSLSMDASLAAWRRLTGHMVLPKETLDAGGTFSTYNAELSVEMGVGFADQSVEWVQVAQVRVEESSTQTREATRDVLALDLAVKCNDFPFVTPYAPRDMDDVRLTTLEGIKDIITTSFPSWGPPVFIVHPSVDIVTIPPAETSFTGGRWDAVLKLAQSIGVTVYNDHKGRFLVMPLAQDGTALLSFKSGEAGTLVSHTEENTRVEQFNAVGLTCESPNGDGIFAYLVDADPESPTYYDGPFGRKPYMTRNDTITTVDAAIAAARAILARKRSGARDLTLTTVYNPLLQPRDVIAVTPPGGVEELHEVDSIEISLVKATMTVKTHLWTPEVGEPAILRRRGRDVMAEHGH